MKYRYLDEPTKVQDISIAVVEINSEAFVNLIADEEYILVPPERLIELLEKEEKLQKIKA